MKTEKTLNALLLSAIAASFGCGQQAKDAHLPYPGSGPFNGKIALDIRESKPDWTPFLPKVAPQGAPNILFILYDDTGLAA